MKKRDASPNYIFIYLEGNYNGKNILFLCVDGSRWKCFMSYFASRHEAGEIQCRDTRCATAACLSPPELHILLLRRIFRHLQLLAGAGGAGTDKQHFSAAARVECGQ